jgi:sulfide:quinone oxidoreductase
MGSHTDGITAESASDPVHAEASAEPFRVVIAGGGVAAIEGALALHELAPGRVSVTIVAPAPEFVYRPLTVAEPFAYGPARRYPLAQIAADTGAALLADSFAWVDPGERVAHTGDGRELGYDALLLALGAHTRSHYEHVLTIDDRCMDEILHGVIQDIEDQFIASVAFLEPPGAAWPLPIYELALMTATRAHDVGVDLRVTVVTPERSPLAIFGAGASEGVSELLERAGVRTFTSAYAQVPQAGHLVISHVDRPMQAHHNGHPVINPSDRVMQADRIIALPSLSGPAVRGIASTGHGFIPTDAHGRVHGSDRVFAAGDATDFPVKQGGLAAQQTDVAAQSIAALAGADIVPQPFEPILRGTLLTGAAPRYLKARITDGRGFRSEISDTPNWSPPAKIAAKFLAPYLDKLDRIGEHQVGASS